MLAEHFGVAAVSQWHHYAIHFTIMALRYFRGFIGGLATKRSQFKLIKSIN